MRKQLVGPTLCVGAALLHAAPCGALAPADVAADETDVLALGAPPPAYDSPVLINADVCRVSGSSGDANSPSFAALEANLKSRGGNSLTFEELIDAEQLGGLSIAWIRNFEIETVRWFGCRDRKSGSPTEENTKYHMASLSKMVTAMLAVKADSEGVLSLDGTFADVRGAGAAKTLYDTWYDTMIAARLPDLYVGVPIRRLLSHTAGISKINGGAVLLGREEMPTQEQLVLGTDDTGLSDYASGIEAAKLVVTAPLADLLDSALSGPAKNGADPGMSISLIPGTDYSYSSGLRVFQLALSKKTAATFEVLAQKKLFTVAGLSSLSYLQPTAGMLAVNTARGCSTTTCDFDLIGHPDAASGGLIGTVSDYAQLLVAVGHGGITASGIAVLTAPEAATMLVPESTARSSLEPCDVPGATSTSEGWTELCVAGARREIFNYSLGLGLPEAIGARFPEILDDGYPRFISHGGSMDGVRNWMVLDRLTGNGMVLGINGVEFSYSLGGIASPVVSGAEFAWTAVRQAFWDAEVLPY